MTKNVIISDEKPVIENGFNSKVLEELQDKEDKVKTKKDKSKSEDISYLKLFKYATTVDKLCIFLGCVSAILCGILNQYIMILFGDLTGAIVDYVTKSSNDSITASERQTLDDQIQEDVKIYAILFVVDGILTTLTTYISSVLLGYSAARQIYKIRKDFFEKTLNQDMSWYDLHQTGDFATTFTDNLSKVEDGIGEKIGIFIFFEATFVSGIIIALIRGWQLALICMISLPLSTVSMGFVTWISTKFSKQELESYASAGSIAEEVLSSVRTVVAFDGQEKEQKRYNEFLVEAKQNNIKKSLFNGFSNALMWFFVFACYALSFWYGVGLIIDERSLPEKDRVYTAGNMIAVFFATLMASWNFGQAAPFFETFGAAKGAGYKVFSVLENEPVINKSKISGSVPDYFKGDIIFKDVCFNYPSRPDVKILKNLNLKIKYGETVALVGSSGCGKSTAIQLIQRFYDTISGTIEINNSNIKDINLVKLRERIGVVGQEPALFATSIKENIRYGKLSATQEEIEEAAKKANAHKFISQLPHGYNTVIGERGAQLSGGQKQRIAIARALIRHPDILLLDEATSALDTHSEAEVQEALDSINGECTTIIVAHRLSTVRNADRIIVLSEGQVVEEGSHSQLIERKGVYYNLTLSQGLIEEDNKEESNQNDIKLTRLLSNLSNKSFGKNDKKYEEEEIPNEETAGDEKKKGSLWKIIKMNGPEWFSLTIGFLSSIITGASLPVYGIVFGDIVGILSNEDSDQLRSDTNFYCLMFVAIGIVTGAATFFQMFSFAYAGEKLTFRLRKRTFAAMLKQEMGWYDRKDNGVGSLCAKLAGDAASVQGAGGIRIGSVLNSISTFLLSCALGLVYEWKLALILISFSPLILMSVYFEQRVLQGDAEKNQKILEKSSKIAVEAISNIRTVASLGCEDEFSKLYLTELEPYIKVAEKKSHMRGVVLGMARSLMFYAYAAGLSFGVHQIVLGNVEYGIVFKVSEIVITGAWSIGNAMSLSPNFQKGLNAASSIFALLDRVPLVKDLRLAQPRIWKNADVNYNQIFFSYPTRPSVSVLTGLDLSILDGQTVALVGSSGCGKSTLIQLLERFYDPIAGEIKVDDINTNSMTLKSLRAQLGIVSQEPNLFDKTIAENIAYGANDREVPMDDIIEAAKSANIHNFISSLPLGYETRIGTKGAQLSGGQKQRIAIARALVRNPRILLLDEATSALDNESEKIVQEALDNAKQGRTCITIAHRLTTIQDADVICVVNEGHIVEMGKHAQLMEKRGLYYKFYKLQTQN